MRKNGVAMHMLLGTTLTFQEHYKMTLMNMKELVKQLQELLHKSVTDSNPNTG